MAYIGQSPVIGEFKKLDDISGSFDNTTTTFNLTSGGQSVTLGGAQTVLVSLNGVIQEPIASYVVYGSSITFTEAPNTNSTFFGVQLGSVGQANIPADGTVSTIKILDNAVTTPKIADSNVSENKIASLAVTESKIATGAVTNAKIADGNISENKIATSAVTEAKIASDAITTSKIANSSITGEKLTALSNIQITGGNITQANIYNVGLKVLSISSSSNVITLDYQLATVFLCNATEAANITLSNFPESGVALLKLTNGGNHVIDYSGNASFATATAPTLTTNGKDYLYFEGNANGYLVTSVLDVREP